MDNSLITKTNDADNKMNFELRYDKSKVFDFTYFPMQSTVMKQENWISKYTPASSLELREELLEDLKPWHERIDNFLINGLYLGNRMVEVFGLLNIQDEVDFLDKVRNISDEDMNYILLRYLESIPGIPANYNSLDLSLATLRKYLADAMLSGEDKWKMLNLFMDPRGLFQEYCNILEEIQPIFEKHYTKVAQRVKDYCLHIQKQIMEGETTALEILAPEFLNQDIEDRLIGTGKRPILIINGLDNFSMLYLLQRDKNYVLGIGTEMEDLAFNIIARGEDKRESLLAGLWDLSDGTRYRILKYLSEGIRTNKELAEKLGVTSAAISYHLRMLLQDKMVIIERPGYVVNERRILEISKGILADFNIKF